MMAWIEVDYKMPEFLKTVQDELFCKYSSWLKKNLEHLQKMLQ